MIQLGELLEQLLATAQADVAGEIGLPFKLVLFQCVQQGDR